MEAAWKISPGMDIEQLAAQVRQLALSQELVVVPATPVPQGRSGYLVLLDHHDLNPEEFCQLAAFSGAKLLYVQTEEFHAGSDPDAAFGGHLESEHGNPKSDEVVRFRQDVERFDGRVRQLELAFAAGCVLHCWAVTAEWYLNLINRAAELLNPH